MSITEIVAIFAKNWDQFIGCMYNSPLAATARLVDDHFREPMINAMKDELEAKWGTSAG